MKKILSILSCALLLAGCGKDPEQAPSTPVTVSSVRVTPDHEALYVGETLQLKADVQPADAPDKTVSWTTSRADVATVDANGLVTAVAPGIASIQASAGSKSANCIINVSIRWVAVSGVTLDAQNLTLTVGEKTTLHATVSPADASEPEVRWKSDNLSVATVDGSGQVQALAPGEALVTATAGDVSATCHVTVNKAEVPVASITLSATSLELEKGERIRLTATVLPADADDPAVGWTSSAPEVASVDASGWVTAITIGKAVITARAGSCSATCEIVVTEKVSGGNENIGYDD